MANCCQNNLLWQTKTFIIYKLTGYSSNLRKEVTKKVKYYFVDNGIRNAIIGNLNPLELRNDVGQLWENYILSERLKYQGNKNMMVNNFFWRTWDQQEIDWVEEREGKLYGYEIKWREQKVRIPHAWKMYYPEASFQVIHQNNYTDWVVPRVL